ncbi:M56 family metallopeptidase [Flavitalea sp.]|nr:M56 family metallopeptidase [Flavitalea sp.]
MGPILQSAFLKALGWSLIDSLWQMGVVWLIYLAITRSGKRFNANLRHNLALLSLAAGSGWFMFSLIFNTFSGRPGTAAGFSNLLGQVPDKLDAILPWLSVAYLVVAMILAIRLHRQHSYTKTLSTKGLRKADPEIRVFLQHLAAQMGLKKEIRVWISELVETPLTVGFWKPVILLPVSIINNLSLKQTESIILHELYHIQRNDFLMNLLIAVADIILFFNPFARFFKDVIQREREHRCDDIVVQFRYDATLYAQALLILEKQRPERNQLHKISLAATGNNKMLLLARVRRLLTGETVATPISQRLISFLLPALFLGYLGWKVPVKDLSSSEPVPVVMTKLISTRVPGSELPQLFSTTAPVTDPAATSENQSKNEQIVEDFKNAAEDINIEKDFAKVIVTGKVEELISAVARSPHIEYVNAEQPREYTISIEGNASATVEVPAAPDAQEKPFPYVPGSSFTYKLMEDTAFPKKSHNADLTTQVQLARTMNAIDGLNWSQIERNLEKAGEKLNIERLQLELKKAVAEIDWKTLNEDLSKTSHESATEVEKYRTQLAERYIQFEKAKIRKAELIKAAEVEMVDDRLKQTVPSNKSKVIRVKKIVNI